MLPCVLPVVLASTSALLPQDPQTQVADGIVRAALASDAATRTLEQLCDRIGGRLTGSPAHRAAVEYLAGEAEHLGLRVAVEPFRVPSTWTRAPIALRATAPVERELPALAAAWTPAVVDGLHGAVLCDPAPGVDVAGRIVLIDPNRVPLVARKTHPFRDAALVLIDAQRPYGLVPTGLGSFAAPFVPATVPAAFVGADDAAWLRRLTAAGATVEVAAAGGGALGESAESGDLIVELPGVGGEGRATEVVVAFVGLDSWDVGSGAVADAAGVAVALEAARLLAGLDGRPQRTIRFVFLAGTQQGVGTTGYAARRDAADLARHVGGFVLEGGGGRLLGLHLDGSAAHLEIAERWFAPVRELGVRDIGFRGSRTELPRGLQAKGIPLFAFVQETPELPTVLGTRADVPDRVAAADLQQAAAVLAIGMLAVANDANRPPPFGR